MEVKDGENFIEILIINNYMIVKVKAEYFL